MSFGSSSTMATPATTASRVSLPARIISIAFAVARKPFALDITIGRDPLDWANVTGDNSLKSFAPNPATALVRKKSRRVTLAFIVWPPRIMVQSTSIGLLLVVLEAARQPKGWTLNSRDGQSGLDSNDS